MIILGLQRLAVISAAIGLAVNIALNLLLVPAYGFLAAAWITLVTEVIVNGIVLVRVRRGMEMQIQTGRIARTGAAGAGLAAVLVGMGAAGAPFAAQILAAGVVYPALLLALGALRVEDIAVLLRRRPV